MKIKCVKIYKEFKKIYVTSSSSLTIGKEYTVLEIRIHSDKIYYRIYSDNPPGGPSLHLAFQFEITSEKIPSNWQIGIVNSTIVLSPKPWQEDDFWESFFDGDLKTIEIFKREAQIIYREEDNLALLK